MTKILKRVFLTDKVFKNGLVRPGEIYFDVHVFFVQAIRFSFFFFFVQVTHLIRSCKIHLSGRPCT